MTTTVQSPAAAGTGEAEKMTSMHAVIRMPYTLSSGPAAGLFLAELANHRIVGSKSTGSDKVFVPAQDFDATTGEQLTEFVEVPQIGEVTGLTTTATGTYALIRLAGASTDLLHRLIGDCAGTVSVGDTVRAVWADEPAGVMTDLAGFEKADGAGGVAPAVPLERPAEPLAERPYELELHYNHAFGPYYGTLFDEIAGARRVLGVKCPSCRNVLVPPREFCDVCFQRTAEWVDVADTGVIQACSVVHIEFTGQTRKPPYVYAEIVLDGASTRLIHTVGNVDVATAPELVRPGMRVRAVWREGASSGSLEDIEYFELAEDLS
jgi:uncharacterized OB-fold protein